jgi:hypothetical protein
MLLSTAIPSLIGKVIGLAAVLLGLTWAASRQPALFGRSTATTYSGPSLVLSWLCVVLGVGVLVQQVVTGDIFFGVLLGLLGIVAGVPGILKARAGE